jgi:regulator of extracellular matrix RemA (YlzA/DUF370 family)
MGVTMLNVGFQNYVAAERIVAVVGSDSAPMRRLVKECRNNGNLVDATQGRRTRCLIFMDSGQVVLSAISREAVARRTSGQEPFDLDEEEEEFQQPPDIVHH